MVTQYDVVCKLNAINNLLDSALAFNYQYPNQEDILSAIHTIYGTYDDLVSRLDKAIDEINIVLENPRNNI